MWYMQMHVCVYVDAWFVCVCVCVCRHRPQPLPASWVPEIEISCCGCSDRAFPPCVILLADSSFYSPLSSRHRTGHSTLLNACHVHLHVYITGFLSCVSASESGANVQRVFSVHSSLQVESLPWLRKLQPFLPCAALFSSHTHCDCHIQGHILVLTCIYFRWLLCVVCMGSNSAFLHVDALFPQHYLWKALSSCFVCS